MYGIQPAGHNQNSLLENCRVIAHNNIICANERNINRNWEIKVVACAWNLMHGSMVCFKHKMLSTKTKNITHMCIVWLCCIMKSVWMVVSVLDEILGILQAHDFNQSVKCIVHWTSKGKCYKRKWLELKSKEKMVLESQFLYSSLCLCCDWFIFNVSMSKDTSNSLKRLCDAIPYHLFQSTSFPYHTVIVLPKRMLLLAIQDRFEWINCITSCWHVF